MFLLSLFLLAILSTILGRRLCVGRLNTRADSLAPVLGFALIAMIASTAFILNIPPAVPIVIITGAAFFSYRRVAQTEEFYRLPYQLRSFVIAAIIIGAPYLIRNGFNDVVTGYHTCNDPVIHALLSKGNAIDGQVHAKLYPSGRILPYPVAAHSVINLISLMPGTDVRNLVFGIALFSLALCVFPLKILITESRGVSTKSILDDIFAGLAASTFYNAAVAYHGFLPQVSFVPFALTALILLRTEAQESPQKSRPSLALSALSAAAAVASYSFAAAIVLAVGLVISPWGIGVRRHVKLGMTFTALVTIIMGANLIPLFELAGQVISYFFDASKTPPILRESSSFGNLVGFLNPLMWTGLWWEQDYRMQSIKDPISQIVLFFSGIGIYLSARGISDHSPAASLNARLLTCGALAYLAILVKTGSPYSTGKIGSFVAPVITATMIRGVFTIPFCRITRSVALLSLASLLLASNIHLLRFISILPADVIHASTQIARDFSGKRLLIFSDNDWLLYTIDSETVDIIGLHYLPDKLTDTPSPSAYDAIVFHHLDPVRSRYTCLQESEYGPFVVCVQTLSKEFPSRASIP